MMLLLLLLVSLLMILLKGFRDLELKIGNMTDTVASRGGRKVIGKTVDRLIDAMSPQRQRTSAAIQVTDCCWCI